jgi:hypothetical protein
MYEHQLERRVRLRILWSGCRSRPQVQPFDHSVVSSSTKVLEYNLAQPVKYYLTRGAFVMGSRSAIDEAANIEGYIKTS